MLAQWVAPPVGGAITMCRIAPAKRSGEVDALDRRTEGARPDVELHVFATSPTIVLIPHKE